eukprot:Skav207556  [mRNA]  locus=scaffold1538:18636:19208:+ [translate_table: standard]
MSDCPCLEWAWGGAGPGDWTLLEAIEVEEAPGFPGWFVPSFELWDETSAVSWTCKFVEWASDQENVAIYAAGIDLGFHGYIPYGTIFVRQVPCCLVFNCDLTIEQNSETFEAKFYTLAGNVMLKVQDTLPGILTLDHLLDYVLDTAEENGALESRNQSIRLLLNGEALELPPTAVLWCDTSPCGWLQQDT